MFTGQGCHENETWQVMRRDLHSITMFQCLHSPVEYPNTMFNMLAQCLACLCTFVFILLISVY